MADGQQTGWPGGGLPARSRAAALVRHLPGGHRGHRRRGPCGAARGGEALRLGPGLLHDAGAAPAAGALGAPGAGAEVAPLGVRGGKSSKGARKELGRGEKRWKERRFEVSSCAASISSHGRSRVRICTALATIRGGRRPFLTSLEC